MTLRHVAGAMSQERKLVWTLAVAYFFTQGCPILAAAMSEIVADLRASPVELGSVVSVYSGVLGLSFLAGGLLAGRVPRSALVLAGSVGTALAFLFCAGAGGLWTFGFAFALLGGFAQSFFYPAASSLLSERCPRHVGSSLATLQVMLYAGSFSAAVIGGCCADCGEGCWRIAFLVFGLGGLLASAGVLKTLRWADGMSAGSDACRDGSLFRSVFASRVFLLLLLAFGFTTAMDLGVRTWGPMFLETASGSCNCASATTVLFCLNVGACGGAVLGGLLADRTVVRCPHVRLLIASVALLTIIPLLFLLSRTDSLVGAGVCLTAIGVGRGVLDASLFASVLERLPIRLRSSAMGLFLGLSYVLGAFAPVLVGGIFKTVGLRQGMAAVAAFPLLAAICAAGAFFVGRRFAIIRGQQ